MYYRPKILGVGASLTKSRLTLSVLGSRGDGGHGEVFARDLAADVTANSGG